MSSTGGSRSATRLLLELGRPHLPIVSLGFACLALTNWLTVEIPMAIGRAVDALPAGGAARPIVEVGLMGAAVIAVRTLSRVWVFNPARRMEEDLRQRVFDHLLALQPTWYATTTTGEITNRASNDVGFVRVLLGFGVMQSVNVTVALLMTVGRMLSVSWALTLAALVPIAIGMAVTRRAVNRVFDLHRESQRLVGALSDHVLGSFQGISTVQGFRAEERFAAAFGSINGELQAVQMKSSVQGALALPALRLVGNAAVFAALAWGGLLAVRGALSVGEVVAFITLLGLLLPPLSSLGWTLSVFTRGKASVERVVEVLEAPVERTEGDGPASIPAGPPGFRVQGLDFAYPSAPAHPVLRGVGFTVPPGAVVGVFGRTGAGKSTLLALLARVVAAPPGAIQLVGGDGHAVDLRAVSLDAWRAALAVAPQRPFLFGESIAENVRMGTDDPGGARVAAALRDAALDVDLRVLPDGADTVVGERGILLSGGQRQRVALARALARPDARLLLLDDVLSAVDHETERALVTTLRRRSASGGPTTFIVSHRVSALQHCDIVLVLEEGRLVDQAPPSVLLQRPGPFADAAAHQRPTDTAPAVAR